MTTEQAKHTPGPWVIYPLRGYEKDGWIEIRTEDRCLIAAADGFTLTRNGESEEHYGMKVSPANALLIKAAPDLLAELEQELEWLNRPFGLHRYTKGIHDGDCLACVLRSRIQAAIAKASQP